MMSTSKPTTGIVCAECGLRPAVLTGELCEECLDNYDGAPWCQYCGARRERGCECGPIAENH